MEWFSSWNCEISEFNVTYHVFSPSVSYSFASDHLLHYFRNAYVKTFLMRNAHGDIFLKPSAKHFSANVFLSKITNDFTILSKSAKKFRRGSSWNFKHYQVKHGNDFSEFLEIAKGSLEHSVWWVRKTSGTCKSVLRKNLFAFFLFFWEIQEGHGYLEEFWTFVCYDIW